MYKPFTTQSDENMSNILSQNQAHSYLMWLKYSKTRHEETDL